MADLPLILTGALGALALGAAAAELTGPLASDWRARKGILRRRLLDIATPARLSGPGRRLAGGAILAATLTGGALTAYAAQPSAPERLAGQAAGVVGSGDQLSLRLVEDNQARTIRPGDDYADGWKLDVLTATSATLVKDGQRREVGLNPTGAVASRGPAAAPSRVTLAGLPAEATIQGAVDAALAKDPKALETAMHGGVLSLEEARRYLAYRQVLEEEVARRYPGAFAALTAAGERPLLGEAGEADYDAMGRKIGAASIAARIADLAARPLTGPTSYYLPAGTDYRQVPEARGADARGVWRPSAPDAQGGRTVTLIAGTAAEVAAYYGGIGENYARVSLFNTQPPAETQK